MKSYIFAALIFALLLVSIPAIPLIGEKTADKPYEKAAQTEETTQKTEAEKETAVSDETYIVFDISTGKTEEIPVIDYIVGAVCAEMPATFETEALKAQAVAAHTYAERQKQKALTTPDPELNGAYFSNDSTKYQAYFTESQARQYYGENYEQYAEKIRKAAEAVADEILVYNDEPIIAAFHSMSSGKTESAENIWGSEIEYLVSVESKEDKTAPKYLEEYSFTTDEMRKLLETAFEDIKLGSEPEKWFGKAELSDAGTVLGMPVGDMTLTGQEIRTALSLRSAAFEVKYDKGFAITTKGYGHAVGMSQYGANAMAQEGSTYKEILAHYYPGTELERVGN